MGRGKEREGSDLNCRARDGVRPFPHVGRIACIGGPRAPTAFGIGARHAPPQSRIPPCPRHLGRRPAGRRAPPGLGLRRPVRLFRPHHRRLLPPQLRRAPGPGGEHGLPRHGGGRPGRGLSSLPPLSSGRTPEGAAGGGPGGRDLPTDRGGGDGAGPGGIGRRRGAQPASLPPAVSTDHRPHPQGLCRCPSRPTGAGGAGRRGGGDGGPL